MYKSKERWSSISSKTWESHSRFRPAPGQTRSIVHQTLCPLCTSYRKPIQSWQRMYRGKWKQRHLLNVCPRAANSSSRTTSTVGMISPCKLPHSSNRTSVWGAGEQNTSANERYATFAVEVVEKTRDLSSSRPSWLQVVPSNRCRHFSGDPISYHRNFADAEIPTRFDRFS